MRALVAGIALLISALGANAAPLPTNVDVPRKVAASGVPLVLWQVSSVAPDCSSVGNATFRMLSGPSHGNVIIRPAKVFSRAQSACTGRRVAGEQAVYSSRPNYVGPEAVDFEVIFPNGEAQRVHIPITVM